MQAQNEKVWSEVRQFQELTIQFGLGLILLILNHQTIMFVGVGGGTGIERVVVIASRRLASRV